MSGLTEEQKRKIEENKQRARAIRIEKLSPVKPSSISQLTSNIQSKHDYVSNNNRYQSIPISKPSLPSSKSNINANKWANNADNRSTTSQTFGASKETLQTTGRKLSGKCVFVGNNSFIVEIGYYAPLIEYFKQLTTRSYDSTTKLWSFKMEEYDTLMKGVRNFRPDIEIEALPPWILKIFSQNNKDVNVVPTADLSHVDEKLVQALLPFQRDGVNSAIHHNGRLLIADDMGLGKTLQAICIACYYRKEWPLLIVSPSSVRFDWAQQICKWLPSVAPCDINVVETGRASATSGMINIVSYDLLSKKADDLRKKMFKVIIMDESHFLKNSRTVRTKAATPLLKTAKRVLLLSGTPALSRPNELFSQITAICPDLFKFHDFGLRYCSAKKMQWGWDYSSSSNMVELQALLEKRIMIRRQKKDVLSQLPAKYRQVIMLDPHAIHKHKDLKEKSKSLSSSKLKGASKRGALLEYFHETCKAKLSAVGDYILDLIEAEKKFLVFAHHKEMLDCVEDTIKAKASHIQYIRIDGRTSSEQRNFFCSKFQTCDTYRVAILSITAANAGLNLSAANIVVFAELFWNPGILVQAEDRAHRIGQQDSVSVQYLVAQHTADDYIWPLVQSKLDTLSKAGLAKDDFSESDTTRLSNNTQQTILDMFSSELIDVAVHDMSMTDDKMTPDISVNVQGLSPEKIDVNVISSSPLCVKINVVAEETKPSTTSRTPRKNAAGDWTRKVPAKQLTSTQSSTLTQGQVTPSKRQASITSFFERTPPKKMLRLDGDSSLAQEQAQDHENVTAEKSGGDKKQDDDFTDMLWLDDDFTMECQDNDTNIGSSLTRGDESGNKTSQESKAGGERSPCVTSQGSKTEGERSPYVSSPESKTIGDKSPCAMSQESRSESTPNKSQSDLLWLQDLNWDDE